jgi:hypothetical protein
MRKRWPRLAGPWPYTGGAGAGAGAHVRDVGVSAARKGHPAGAAGPTMLWSAKRFPPRCRGFARAEHVPQLVRAPALAAGGPVADGTGHRRYRHPPDGKGDPT